jgi:5-methylcytosine-specific restriction protein A
MGIAGQAIYHSPRWNRARFHAKRCDGFACAQCGSRHRLEVHHVESIRTAPERAFDLDNLKTLCRECHLRETEKELGRAPDAAQSAWKAAVAELARPNERKRRCWKV